MPIRAVGGFAGLGAISIVVAVGFSTVGAQVETPANATSSAVRIYEGFAGDDPLCDVTPALRHRPGDLDDPDPIFHQFDGDHTDDPAIPVDFRAGLPESDADASITWIGISPDCRFIVVEAGEFVVSYDRQTTSVSSTRATSVPELISVLPRFALLPETIGYALPNGDSYEVRDLVDDAVVRWWPGGTIVDVSADGFTVLRGNGLPGQLRAFEVVTAANQPLPIPGSEIAALSPSGNATATMRLDALGWIIDARDVVTGDTVWSTRFDERPSTLNLITDRRLRVCLDSSVIEVDDTGRQRVVERFSDDPQRAWAAELTCRSTM